MTKTKHPAAQAQYKQKQEAAWQQVTTQHDQQSDDRVLLSPDDLWAFGVRFSRVQLWKQVKIGAFPKPIKLSANRNAWLRNEVLAWVAARAAERAA